MLLCCGVVVHSRRSGEPYVLPTRQFALQPHGPRKTAGSHKPRSVSTRCASLCVLSAALHTFELSTTTMLSWVSFDDGPGKRFKLLLALSSTTPHVLVHSSSTDSHSSRRAAVRALPSNKRFQL